MRSIKREKREYLPSNSSISIKKQIYTGGLIIINNYPSIFPVENKIDKCTYTFIFTSLFFYLYTSWIFHLEASGS